MKQIIFESSPAFVVLCISAGVGYAYLLYRSKHPWSKPWNRLLFTFRALLVFFLAFLLLGPIVKQINNLFEKPLFVILNDDSGSMKEVTDTLKLRNIQQDLNSTREVLMNKGYEVEMTNLAGEEINTVQWNATFSDLNAALKKVSNRYEGRNIGGVILVSDGIYNVGLSPLYATYNFPVYTVGVGDTSQRVDLSIKNISYNKIAYLGNKFPLRVEVLVAGLSHQNVNVSLLQRGNVLAKKTKNSTTDQLLIYDFEVLANEQGIQKLDLQVEVNPEEYNKKNNRTSVFVEVVEGKKKILVVASAPHPDIKALREVIGKNSNYEFLLHIPGLSEQQASVLKPDQNDLAIFHQAPDTKGKTRDLFQQFSNSKTSMFLVLGQQSDVLQLGRQNMPVNFLSSPRDYDEVTPVINPGFSSFTLGAEVNSLVTDFPPVSVHFGKVQISPGATSILFQRVGSVTTDKPLLVVTTQDSRKIGVMLGEGLWRWRLNEFDRTENTIAFDELFGKLIQYLSTAEDKRKFRSYPVQQEFSDSESVAFESQVYNDIFEPVFGNSIDLDITNENGRKTSYSYVTSPGNSRYQLGALKEGVYRYKSKTTLNQRVEEVKGEFAVVARQLELQNLTADFHLMRKLATNTGGKFYAAPRIGDLTKELQLTEAKSLLHSEERYNSLINLKWIFWILVSIISVEWFLRKYFGSY